MPLRGQVLEVVAHQLLVIGRDQLAVDLALGGGRVLGQVVRVGNQLAVGAPGRVARVALRSAASGAGAGDVDLLGRLGALAAGTGAVALAGAAAAAAVSAAATLPGALALALGSLPLALALALALPRAGLALARLLSLPGLLSLPRLLALAGTLLGGLGLLVELRLGLLEAVDGLVGVAVEVL